MACRIFMVKRFHHLSDKQNDVFCYDITLETEKTSAIVATVFSRNVAIKFVKAVETVINDPENVSVLVSMLHVVHHTNRKLQGLDSISTSCLKNPVCLARMKDVTSICHYCYAGTQQAMQHGLDDNNALNYYLLNNVLFTEAGLALVPMFQQYCRIESFGDVASVTQARNYIRLIRSHSTQSFAIWTKNVQIWEKAFDIQGGKPENTTFVQSSIRQNVRDNIRSRYVDHVFTVWSNEKTANENGVEITCGGRKCRTCLRCYKKDTGLYVDELHK